MPSVSPRQILLPAEVGRRYLRATVCTEGTHIVSRAAVHGRSTVHDPPCKKQGGCAALVRVHQPTRTPTLSLVLILGASRPASANHHLTPPAPSPPPPFFLPPFLNEILEPFDTEVDEPPLISSSLSLSLPLPLSLPPPPPFVLLKPPPLL